MMRYTSMMGVALLLMAGCATVVDTSSPNKTLKTVPVCWIGRCNVSVIVDSTPGRCAVTAVDKPDLPIWGSHNIFWSFADGSAEDYVFTDDGIVFKDPKGQFDQRELHPTGRSFKFHDKNENDSKGTYEYKIYVKRGAMNCSLDPTIINQGRPF